MDDRKRKKLERNKTRLEEWKRSKQESLAQNKIIFRPPFRPVGKSTITYDAGSLDKYLLTPKRDKSKKKSMKLPTINTKKISNKYTSTPFFKNNKDQIPIPFKNKKISDFQNKRDTFDIQTPITTSKNMKKSYARSKSVQFHKNIVEISAGDSSELKKSFTPNATHLTNDEVRRISYAGRTPFSCATSRSGSTPGRKDFPSKILQNIDDDNRNDTLQSINDTKNSKNVSSLRKRKSISKILNPRWSVAKNSIIQRDPYQLRSQTPIQIRENNSIKLTYMTSAIKNTPRINSERKKSLKVNFGSVVVNQIDSDRSINRDDEKENSLKIKNEQIYKTSIFETSAQHKESALDSYFDNSLKLRID